MLVKLTLGERIIVTGLDLLPISGSTRIGLKLREEICNLVAPSSEELIENGYVEDVDTQTISLKTNPEKEFEFSEHQVNYIKENLDRLDSLKLFNVSLMKLEAKFQ